MTLTEARTYLARLTRSGADDGRYTSTDLDLALAEVGTRFCRETQIVRATATCTLASGSAAVTGFGALTNFRPERLLRARVRDTDATDDLIIVDAGTMENLQTDTSQTIPTHMAFYTHTTAEVWPLPDAIYTIDIYTWENFVPITPGGSSVTINIPDDLVFQVLRFAAAWAMQSNVTDRNTKFSAGGEFEQFILDTKGRGSTGGDVVTRASLSPARMVDDPSEWGV